MKTDQLLTIGLAGIAVYLIYKMVDIGKVGAAVKTTADHFVDVIDNQALPGQPGYGWTYFENGTVIDPNGAYYLNGKQVWRPT